MEFAPLAARDPITLSIETFELQQARLGQEEKQHVADIIHSRVSLISVFNRLVYRSKH